MSRAWLAVALGCAVAPFDLPQMAASTGVIAGVIRDWREEPAALVPVSVIRIAPTEPKVTRTVITGHAGAYRVFGLPAGSYLVVATPRLAGVGPVGSRTQGELDDLFGRLERRDLAGLSGQAPQAALTVVPTYYPGTPDAESARTIALGEGGVSTGVDMSLQLLPTVSVEGSVIHPQGSVPPNAVLLLAEDGPSLPPALTISLGTSMLGRPVPDREGRFRYESVAPGRYTVTALSGRSVAAPDGLATVEPDSLLYAEARLSVSGVDLSGISLVLRAPVHFAGRIVVAERSGPVPAGIEVVLTPIDRKPLTGAGPFARVLGAPASVGADGSFQVDGLLPGTYSIACRSSTGDWTVQELRAAGVAIIGNGPLHIGGGHVEDAVVMIAKGG